MLRVALRLRPMMVFLSGRMATPYGREMSHNVLGQAVGGLRTPLSRQGQLRRGWPLKTFPSPCVLEGERGRLGGLACSQIRLSVLHTTLRRSSWKFDAICWSSFLLGRRTIPFSRQSSSFGSAELHSSLRHHLRLWKLPDVDACCWAGSIMGPPRPIEPMAMHVRFLENLQQLIEYDQVPREHNGRGSSRCTV